MADANSSLLREADLVFTAPTSGLLSSMFTTAKLWGVGIMMKDSLRVMLMMI
jgi:hypothetical protein